MGFTLSTEGFNTSFTQQAADRAQTAVQIPSSLLHPPTHHKQPHFPLPGIVRDRDLAMGEDPMAPHPPRPWESGLSQICQSLPSLTRNLLPKVFV